MKRTLLAGLCLALGACTGLPGPARPVTHYVLSDPGPVIRTAHTHEGVLLLREMDVSAFYQEPRLAYSRAPGTRAHYEFARWSELPGKRLTWLLRQRLEASGAFRVVAPLAGGVVGDYQLNTRLIDFYHEATSAPGLVLLVVEAELVRRARGELAARRVFVSQTEVARYDAAAAADAMDRAANEVLDQIVLWVAEPSG